MHGQHIGYINVSRLDQHTERQLDGIEVDNAAVGRLVDF
jgi:DNA invertase Pin-like site-specific DNA recombinase